MMNKDLISEQRLCWSPIQRVFVPSAPAAQHSARRFIKGPIPLDWIARAACLPGKTLHVALTLRYLSGLNKTNTVKLSAKTLEIMGVARDAKADALERLQQEALIIVEQLPGRAPVVTLLDDPSHSSRKGGHRD